MACAPRLVVDTGAFEFRPGDCLGNDPASGQDGDVDLVDYAGLEACLSGPAASVPVGCECFDVDGSDHINLGDVAIFQATFTGE